nr:hypothetical protein [Tanacetum cinerariifolium]
MNQNFYEPYMCSNSISSHFDQSQPPQFPVIHQPPQEMSIQEMKDLKKQYLDEMKLLINSEYRDEIKIDGLKGNFNSMTIEINKKEKLQQLEQVANLSTYPSKRFNSFCYDDDDDEDYTVVITSDFPITDSLNQFEDLSDSNDESSSTDDDSFSIGNIEYVEASPLDFELVGSEVMEIVIPDVGGIDDDIVLTIKDDILQISSGSTTTRSDISLPEYEAFYDDHVKEISSGSTTTHSDSSLYDSFIFNLSINPFPPADRSDFYEFADELTHIISPPEYDCFFFKIEPNSGDFTMDVVEDTFPTR